MMNLVVKCENCDEGFAVGVGLSSIVANVFEEEFETEGYVLNHGEAFCSELCSQQYEEESGL